MSDARGPWVHLVERLRRRKLAVAAFAMLALICTSAIYAPIIANDRPYVMEAVDYGAYERALDSIVAVTDEAGPIMLSMSEDSDGPAMRAVESRIATIRRYLHAREQESLLAPLQASIDRGSTLMTSYEETSAAWREASALARRVATELRPRDPRKPDSHGVELVAATSHPLFEALSRLDVFAMVLWPWLLVLAVRAPRQRPMRGVAIFGLMTSLVITAAWPHVFTPSPSLSNAPKAGIASGDIVVESAVFPPLAVGFAETNMTEVFRPPTWTPAAEIDEQGRYVRGARRPVQDPATGFTPATTPVDVRSGEFPRNCKWRHALGTDSLGRDLLARLLWGARTTLAIAFAAAALLIVIGVIVGSTAGWFGGWIDIALSRVIEVVQAFPALFLIVVVAATLSARSQGLGIMVAVVALVGWTGVARLVRAEFLRLKHLEFVLAARALGFGHLRIIVRHVLPNALGPVLVSAAFLVGWSMFVESAVSFLGFGVQQPQPSWGALIQESRAPEHWWILVFPGLAITVTVFCFHALGEALRDALDPRLAP
jgi:peptide/nickel transport system permease protein